METKRCLCLVMAICLVMSMIPITVRATETAQNASIFAGGDGTASTPYLVSTPQQLDAIRQDLSAHYRQINDIDLSNYGNWNPIGTGESMEHTSVEHPEAEPFAGSFDGGNYKIIGLKIHSTEASVFYDCIGLFAHATQAKLSNIQLKDLSISVYRGDDDYETMRAYTGRGKLIIGGICGKSSNTQYDNCVVSGEIQVSEGCDSKVGGIIGDGNYDDLTRCMSEATISVHANRPYEKDYHILSGKSSIAQVGGIAGYARYCSFSYCTNQGNVAVLTGESGTMGGICGLMYEGTMFDCANFGAVRCEADRTTADYVKSFLSVAAGIVGTVQLASLEYIEDHDPFVHIFRCVNYGNIYSHSFEPENNASWAGGVIGKCQNFDYLNKVSSFEDLYNLAESITAVAVNSDAVLEYTPRCGTICASCGSMPFKDCYSLDSTLVNDSLLAGEGDIFGFYTYDKFDPGNGAKRTAQRLLSQDTYPNFDFNEIWIMNEEVGGPVLMAADSAWQRPLNVELTSTKNSNVHIQGVPYEGFDRYEINAKFENTTTTVLENVVAEISLSGYLSLSSGEKSEVSLGSLQPGQVIWAGWNVDAPRVSAETDAHFEIMVNINEQIRMSQDGVIRLDPLLPYSKVYGWPLLNGRESFGYDKDYRFSLERYKETYGYVLWYGVFDNMLKWSGNCFGLSLLSLAHYYGKIDLATYFNQEGENLNDYGYEGIYSDKKGKQCYTVEGNQRALELIERAQITQSSAEIKCIEVFEHDSNYSQLIDFMCSDEARPLLVTTTNHAMVLTTDFKPFIAPDGDYKGWYIFPVYDPNAPTCNGLSEPMDYYLQEPSYLWVNTENGEWAYTRDDKTANSNRYYFPMQTIHFYDVSLLDTAIFKGPLAGPSSRFNVQVYGSNAVIYDEQDNVLFALENGSVVQASKDCEINTQCGEKENSLPVYMIGANVRDIRISSKDAVVTILQEKNLIEMEMNGAYAVYSDSQTGSMILDCQQTDGEFVICTQDKDGHAAKITGRNLTGNRVSIRQEGALIDVKTQNADADLSYECENIGSEGVIVSVMNAIPGWGEKASVGLFGKVMLGVGIVVVCLLLGGVLFVVLRKKSHNVQK